ncbi:MAG TPA: M1 family metallopeptidase [Burkholderiaceae bacterium]
MDTRVAARTLALLACAAGLGCSGPAAAAAPFTFDTAPGRLPKNVVPLDYSISIMPDLAARTFTGQESVDLKFRQTSATIVFNSLDQKITSALLDGQPVKSVQADTDAQLVTLRLVKPAPPGRHTLKLSYSGTIQAHPPGLYVQEFVAPGGAKSLLLSTKFEPTYARRLFPCWDEPAFRSTFQLAVTVPAAWATVSNMPLATRVQRGDLATSTFRRTPKMPTYLLEFTGGDLAQISGDVGRTKVAIWAVRGQHKDGAIALANARQILADYNDYFGTPFPLPKLDSIAVPGGFTGAMENWGAITYNDQLLLVTPSSTLDDRQTVFSVQAHEMAHQWNGDLVTMGWWDDLWLNESFASWRAAGETDLRNPGWRWWEVQDESKEGAMRADARSHSHPIEQHVASEVQVQNAFDPQITYQKGQAVLRMFETYVGPDAFRDGIRAFMKAHAYSNASSADLWSALDAVSGRGIGRIAAGWTEQAGFPLVTVMPTCDAEGRRTIALSQKRFLLQGDDATGSRWQVPLQIRSGPDAPPQAVLLTQDGQTVPAGRCGQTLSVNAGAVGFYRTQYDSDTLRVNTRGFGSLSWGDRIALLDDQWALVESGAQKLPSYLALVEAMGSDVNERAWGQVTRSLGSIEYDERGTPGHEAFAAYARSILKPVADRLGWQEEPADTPGIRKLRRTVIGDLGAWGDPEVIAEARKRFASFVADHSTLSADDQAMVLSIVARHADAAAFQQLHNVARGAANETELRRYFTAIMQVADAQLAAQAANLALSEEVPPQAASVRLQLMVSLNDANPQLAWTTFNRNVDPVMAPHGQYRALILAQYVPQIFWNSVAPGELETWIKTQVPADMAPVIARGMEEARFQLAEKSVLVQAADEYLASRRDSR